MKKTRNEIENCGLIGYARILSLVPYPPPLCQGSPAPAPRLLRTLSLSLPLSPSSSPLTNKINPIYVHVLVCTSIDTPPTMMAKYTYPYTVSRCHHHHHHHLHRKDPPLPRRNANKPYSNSCLPVSAADDYGANVTPSCRVVASARRPARNVHFTTML